MTSLSVSVAISTGGLDAMAAKCAAAQTAFTAKVLEDSSGYVPVRTGSLRDSGTVSGTDTVEWTEDYASYVYHGTGRMAGRPWFEQAKSAHLADWEAAAAKELNR